MIVFVLYYKFAMYNYSDGEDPHHLTWPELYQGQHIISLFFRKMVKIILQYICVKPLIFQKHTFLQNHIFHTR